MAAVSVIAFALWATACGSRRRAMPDVGLMVAVGDDLEITGLATGVWLHTTWRTRSGGARIPSNGLVVDGRDGLYLVDSAWGDEQTRVLATWIEKTMARQITVLLTTHHHADRVSGIRFLRTRGVQVWGHPLTGPLAQADGLEGPDPLQGLVTPGMVLQVGPIEVFFPGPAHAPDNLVVWIPRARILFGGCAVRPAGTTSLGNTDDADLNHWGLAISKVRDRYGSHAVVVVPGHGAPGDTGLLDHTITIAR